MSGRKEEKERVPLSGRLQAPLDVSRLPRGTPGWEATGITDVGLKTHSSGSQRERKKKRSREKTLLKNSSTRLASNQREIRVAVPKTDRKGDRWTRGGQAIDQLC